MRAVRLAGRVRPLLPRPTLRACVRRQPVSVSITPLKHTCKTDGQSVAAPAMFRTFALLSALPCTAAAWSFANFLQGDWDLERVKGDELIRAHYSLQTTPGGALEGSFFEEDSAGGRSNEMRVKVEFDLAAPDIAGSFSMAKAKVFEDDDEAAAPVPQPAGEVEYGEFKALFEFDFHSRNSDHYWISESK